MSSGMDSNKDLKYWKEVGLVAVWDTNNSVVIGFVDEITPGFVAIKELNDNRHWINQDSIVRIMEIGVRYIGTTKAKSTGIEKKGKTKDIDDGQVSGIGHLTN